MLIGIIENLRKLGLAPNYRPNAHLAHPTPHASMADAITIIAHTRLVLKNLGDRPNHEAVDHARSNPANIESSLSMKVTGRALPRGLPTSIDSSCGAT
ncbi:hypothetical protein NL676_025790 [Syzygium grande]|nr:hypothetical protein NL676_025790 [Syzygium grande]